MPAGVVLKSQLKWVDDIFMRDIVIWPIAMKDQIVIWHHKENGFVMIVESFVVESAKGHQSGLYFNALGLNIWPVLWRTISYSTTKTNR